VKRLLAATALLALVAVAAVATRPFWLAPDAAQAQSWLHAAADRRDAQAEASLVRWSGRGNAAARRAHAALLAHRAVRALDAAKSAPDLARAAALMGQAAEGGDAPAMFLYANMLRAGQGVARDDARALALYQAAADADYAPAMQALTIAYRYGELGLQADASQSRLMDHEAAEALAHAAN